MASTATAAEARPIARRAVRPASRQPSLRPVRSAGRARARRPKNWVLAVCLFLVVGSLLLVVASQAYLTQGQVRLARLQMQLAHETTEHDSLQLKVARLENPTNVTSEAKNLGLVAPSKVIEVQQPAAPPAGTSRQATGALPARSGGR